MKSIHRDGDLPADIRTDGTRFWFKDGKQHRDNDLPAVIYADGSRMWFKDGRPHRACRDDPDVIKYDGACEWHVG